MLARREFTLFGLKEGGGICRSELFVASDLFESHAKARQLLREPGVALVEIWEHQVCVLRIKAVPPPAVG